MLKLLRLRELLHQLWPHPAKRRTSATLRDSAPPARRCLPDSPRCRYPKASHLGSGMSRFTHTTLTAVAMSTVASAAVAAAAAAAAAAAPPPPLLLLLLLLAVPHFQLLLYSATGRNVVPADASTTTTIVATVTTTAYVAPPHTHSTPYPSPGTTSKSSRALNPETGEPSFSSVCVSSCMLSCGSRGAKRSAWKSPGVRLAMDSVWDLGFKFGFRVQPPAVAFSGRWILRLGWNSSPLGGWPQLGSVSVSLLASGPASKFSGLGLVPCLSFYRAALMPSSLKPKSLRSQPTHSQPRVTRCRSDHRKPNISFVAPPALHPIYLPAFRHSHSDDRVEACDDESADVKPQIERLS